MEMNFRRFLILVGLCCGSFSWLDAAGFFESEHAVAFRLEAPLSSLRRQRGSEVEWLEGTLYYQESHGSEAALNVKIQARGNFRRQREICHFPPYWINFRKSEVKGTPFAGLDKVKVVSHCNPGRASYEQYVYSEYLAYKTYNVLTDLSFRVRLASINYFNTDRGKDERGYGAFFIEHVDSLEERLRAEQVKDRYVLPSRYNLRELCMAEMFQFFLGNTDFSFFVSEDECCHNAKVFAPRGATSGLFPVPYDFDLAGLVDTAYAAPPPDYPITSVKHRMYRGIEVGHDVFWETVRLYIKKREEIYELWENFELLDHKYRAKALSFIDEFYNIFDQERKTKRPFILKLRKFDSLEKSIQGEIDKQRRRLEKQKIRSEKG